MSFWTEEGAIREPMRKNRFVVTVVTALGEKVCDLPLVTSVSPFSFAVRKRDAKKGELLLRCVALGPTKEIDDAGFFRKQQILGGIFNLRISLLNSKGDEIERFVAQTCKLTDIVIGELDYEDENDLLNEIVYIDHFGILSEAIWTEDEEGTKTSGD